MGASNLDLSVLDSDEAKAERLRIMQEAGFTGAALPATESTGGGNEESPRWMDPDYRRQVIDWTTRVPRPESGDGTPDYLLEGRQAIWDEADAKLREHRGWLAERAAERDRREREAKEAGDRAFAEQELAKLRPELRAAYFRADPTATDADFERDLPGILAERRRAAAAGVPAAPELRSLIGKRQFLGG